MGERGNQAYPDSDQGIRARPVPACAGRPVERVRKLHRSTEPIRRRFGQRPHDRRVHRRRDRLPQSPHRRDRIREPLGNHHLRARPGIGRLPSEHLIQHARETVDVAPPVDWAAPARLLRTHVRRCPHRNPRLGEPPAPGLRNRPRDPEVRHHRFPARQQNVLRLDVAVHHVVVVGVSKGARHLARDPQGLLDRQLTLPLEPVAQRFTFDVRHDVIEEPRRFP